MSQANLGWLFYREYFRGYNYPTDKKGRENAAAFFEEKNKKLYAFKQADYGKLTDFPQLAEYPGFQSFSLTTDYPGLLIGTGYNHDVAAVGATKIGFYFDYTTGLPVYPGSSVKGLLREVFPQRDLDATKNVEARKGLAAGRSAYLRETLINIGIPETEVNHYNYLLELEEELFNGHVPAVIKGEPTLLPIPITQRFICHDAVVTATNGQLMGPDFITPHQSRKEHVPNTIIEPNPIQLLKVMPGVTFQFTFQAAPSYKLETGEERLAKLTPQQLTQLCRQILLDRGIGAKTNVGYGQLTDPATAAAISQPRSKGQGTGTAKEVPKLSITERAKLATANYFRGKLNYKKEMRMEAEVTRADRPNRVKVFIAEGNEPEVDLAGYRNPIDVGTTILVGVKVRRDLSLESVAFRGFKK
jgi:CRISPR-associated protein Cmr6